MDLVWKGITHHTISRLLLTRMQFFAGAVVMRARCTCKERWGDRGPDDGELQIVNGSRCAAPDNDPDGEWCFVIKGGVARQSVSASQ